MKKKSIIVMASGNGSTFQAIVEKCMGAKVVALFSDQPLCYAVERSRNLGIDHVAFDPQALKKDEMEECFADHADRYDPVLIVLAGYMRILSPIFLSRYPRTINTHPSLLPKYKGLHTYQRVLDSKDMVHGVTVHQVDETLDGGPILAQQSVSIRSGDTVETLRDRTQAIEKVLYPRIIDLVVTGHMGLQGAAKK